MPSEIRVYFEGDVRLKPGFRAFLVSLRHQARCKGKRLKLVAGGTRNDTLEDFALALQQHRDAFAILLVDAEGGVSTGNYGKPWAHLESLQECRLARPQGATDDQAHLMVQAMESWFVADVTALEGYYGRNFMAKRLSSRTIQEIPKGDLEPALCRATEGTQKGKYSKTKHAPDLLARIDPAKVRAASSWCDRLFTTIEKVIEE